LIKESIKEMTIATRCDTVQQIDIAKSLERAHAAWQAGRAGEAEMACREVLAIRPGQADASYLMGLLAYSFGNLDLAIMQMRQACQDARAPAHFLSDFAEMCRQGERLSEGEQAARRAVALAPNFASAWNNLGIILQEMLKLDESKLCLERVLALERAAVILNRMGIERSRYRGGGRSERLIGGME
jgi:tetratricopeptide (TPR) repeat protein